MRLAVVSPFVDRRHGTERVLIEQIERLAREYGCEIHLYAQRAEDLGVGQPAGQQAKSRGRIVWHRVPSVPGPHLFQYVWWFVANHVCRWRGRRFRGLSYDVLYSPGINAPDADAIAVHIVFYELYRRVGPHLRLSGAPLLSWPRLLHRRMYYRLIMALERKLYRDTNTSLSAVSRMVATQLLEFFGRTDVAVIPNGVDIDRFDPRVRWQRRAAARERMRIPLDTLVFLLIGNDWKKKGLDTVLRALGECRELPLKLLVVGRDDRAAYIPLIRQAGLFDCVYFHATSEDVVEFYAAADAYVGPSLDDAYGLPILEAMACGLPVIASVRAGASEMIRDGANGLLLRNPEDSGELAALVRRLASDPALRRQLGEAGALTAREHTWERNAALTWEFLKTVAARKRGVWSTSKP